MSTISFSGISTGMDTASMITQLVNLERTGINQLNSQKQDYQSRISIVQNLNSKLQALQTKAKDFATVDKFLSYETESSDKDFVTVSASGKATPGNYSILVDKLATAERRYSMGFSAQDEAGVAGEGTLTLQVGAGDAVDIDITADDTLESIVAKINSADVEATAGILFDGTSYHLQISGKETGAENALTISESGASLNMDLDDASANIVQAASDAQIQMDGFTITSASNEVTTAIPGVTLRLEDETDPDQPVNISISPSTGAVTTKIKEFVKAYNDIASIIHNEFAFNGEAKSAGRLVGDSTLRSVQMQLSQVMSSAIDGLPGGIQALSQLGIKSDSDGTLKIDETELGDVITNNAGGVAQLFAGTPDHTVEGLGDKLDSLIETFVDYSNGILTAKINGMNSSIKTIDNSITRQEQYVSKYEEKLRAQFTSMEVMVSGLQSQSNFLASQKFLW